MFQKDCFLNKKRPPNGDLLKLNWLVKPYFTKSFLVETLVP
jgi:hypothetical protein